MTSVVLPPFVLRRIAEIARAEGFDNYKVEHKAGSKKGDGFMSNMIAITLVDLSTSKRLPLIFKLQIANPESADGVDSTPLFEREVEMYKTVLPLFEALQRQHGLSTESGFFAYPKCYLSERAGNNESIIVLEDLRTRGFELWDKFVPLRFENVALLLKQLGRYHALSFVLRDQQPQVFAQLQALTDVLGHTFMNSQVMRDLFDSTMQHAIKMLDEEKDRELLRSIESNWFELNQTRQSADKLKRFGVLSHGDCHMNNMMFTVNNCIPDNIALIDFQCSAVVSPATDLTNFLLWCAEKPLRDQHFDELLHIYHAELTRTIAACGSDPSALFSYDDFLEQMREFGFNALSMAPMAVSFMIVPPEDLRSMSDLSANGNNDDVDSKMIAPMNAVTELRYKQRLLDIILDARRLGYSRE